MGFIVLITCDDVSPLNFLLCCGNTGAVLLWRTKSEKFSSDLNLIPALIVWFINRCIVVYCVCQCCVVVLPWGSIVSLSPAVWRPGPVGRVRAAELTELHSFTHHNTAHHNWRHTHRHTHVCLETRDTTWPRNHISTQQHCHCDCV